MSDLTLENRWGANELRGDTAVLSARLGDAGLRTLATEPTALGGLGKVYDVGSLRRFLTGYREEVLFRLELPWILESWRHAEAYEPCELLAMDQRLGREPWWPELATASRRVGRQQLRGLKPLRDLRVLRRYREAVECGQANGWHVVVHGLVLSAYSIPLRSGLASYGYQALGGFLECSSRRLGLSAGELAREWERVVDPLPAGVNRLLTAGSPIRGVLGTSDVRHTS